MTTPDDRDEIVRLTSDDTDLDADLLARLALRTQHRDHDGTPIMSRQELDDAIELDRIERRR